MITVNLDKDEWYPVYTLNLEPVPESLQKYYATFGVDEKELDEMLTVFTKFLALQERLETLYNIHNKE